MAHCTLIVSDTINALVIAKHYTPRYVQKHIDTIKTARVIAFNHTFLIIPLMDDQCYA